MKICFVLLSPKGIMENHLFKTVKGYGRCLECNICWFTLRRYNELMLLLRACCSGIKEIPLYRRQRPPSLDGFEWTTGVDEEVWYRRSDECVHADDPPTPPRWPKRWSGAAAGAGMVIPASPPRSTYSPSSCGKNTTGILLHELVLYDNTC